MKEEIKQAKIKLIILLLLCMTVLGTIGLTFAWFRNLQQLNTVALVQIPSKITLSGANRSELQKISLELTADDTQAGNQVTLRRVFCVESTADFLIEVIRTTNINGMDISVYPVTLAESDLEQGEVKGMDGIKTFYYNLTEDPLSGHYINEDAMNRGTADDTLQKNNYNDEDKVQNNAKPLYWITSDVQRYNDENYSREGIAADGKTKIKYRYYVLQLEWDTSSSETDLVYLLASHKE